jgi:two-component sensor histidine kinase
MSTKFYIKSIFLLSLIVVSFCPCIGQTNKQELIEHLKKAIQESPEYDAGKIIEIDKLRKSFNGSHKPDLFDHYLKLFEAYSIFNYDSAYSYAQKLKTISFELNDSSKITYARIKFNFLLLSSGMFKEVFDSLSTININYLDNLKKAEYYLLMARIYFDLSDYNHDNFFSPRYNIEANNFLDSSLTLFPIESFEYNYYNGLKYIRAGNDNKAAVFFEKLIKDTSLSPHEKALTTSTYADIYFRKEQSDMILELLVQAAIADIETSTKETSAIYNLANFLFKQGDVKNASLFIQKAAADAQFYGARQRMIQVSSVLPVITGKNLLNVENEKKKIYNYAVIITALFAVLLTLIFVIVRQIRILKFQQKEISKKNNSLQELLNEKDLLLEEKEWLRKEIHHRVKNNLHTVLSLLESQSAFLKKEALIANLDSQHRVYSMSLIHQKLYQSESLTCLDMSIYIPELINYLRESFDTKQKIKFILHIEPVSLNVTQSLAVGIIMTEAITNSIKYAFPETNNGIIEISMKKIADDNILLCISDNGVGFAETINLSQTNSLGMRLMKGLSEDINAQFTIESIRGIKITVQFKDDQQ